MKMAPVKGKDLPSNPPAPQVGKAEARIEVPLIRGIQGVSRLSHPASVSELRQTIPASRLLAVTLPSYRDLQIPPKQMVHFT
jgi:hypothetical protein